MAETIESAINSLYSQLLLRDLAGKVLPGALVFYGFVRLYAADADLWARLREMPVGAWILAFAAAWLLGVAIQFAAENVNLIKFSADDLTEEERRSLRNAFRRVASPVERQQEERFVAIKDASGNGYFALALFAALYIGSVAAGFLGESTTPWVERIGSLVTFPNVAMAVAVPLLIYFLAGSHFAHVRRLELHYKEVRAASEVPAPP